MKTKELITVTLISVLFILISGFKNDKIKGAASDYSFIPAGSSSIGDSTVSFNAFWMSQTEVTNASYNLFLADLKQQGKEEDLKTTSVQSDKWKSGMSYSEPYVELYHTHKAYAYYPVVNVTYEGALLYCKWLTSKLEDKNWEYRLPTKKEWIYAAGGGLEKAVYSWGGPYLKGAKGESMGNYVKIGDENIRMGTNGFEVVYNKAKGLINAAKTYKPNGWGLYNMCGNVAEMVQEKGIAMGGSWHDPGYDIRIVSEKSYTEPSPMVGFRPVLVRVK